MSRDHVFVDSLGNQLFVPGGLLPVCRYFDRNGPCRRGIIGKPLSIS